MKVLLIGNYAADGQYSMLGFGQALHSGLCAMGVEARLIAPRAHWRNLTLPLPGAKKWLGYADQYLRFPKELKPHLAWADVVHLCDQGNGIYVNHLQNVPHLVTCHDLLALRAAQGELPGTAIGPTGRVYQRLIGNGLRKAHFVACVSRTTQADVLRVCRTPAAQTSVIYNGLLHAHQPMPAEERAAFLKTIGLSASEPYLLHVGGNQFYKNRLGLLQIYAALRQEWRRSGKVRPLSLVLAGKPITEEMRRFLAAHQLEANVLERSGLDNEQIRALYSGAKALLFPSLYEGFGMPIIEAQACGCPVFTSNRAPMTEVGGEAAVYFDPEKPEQAAMTIAHGLEHTEAMIAGGLENVQRFSTQQMLEGYVQTYQRVLAGTH